MTAIVHRTPGLIDIRSFTTMGMSAKVGDNPLGQFGTGLKYAIAVLVRAGARPVVWIGRDRYEFFCEATDFRGREFQLVRMRVRKWGGLRTVNHNLPFTTEYGRNWKMWMAFRELEANTRDEGGETHYASDEDGDTGFTYLVDPGCTTIVVEHPEYVEAWEKRDEVFLPEGLSVREGTEGLQVIQEPGQRVYYRGMRALDVSKPTFHTYNVLADVEITEDRTLKYEHQVKQALARHLLASEDEALIRQIVTCKDTHWEHNLEFPQWVTPGDTFRRVAESRPKGMWGSVGSYYARYDHNPSVTPLSMLESHPRPWRIGDSDVRDANGVMVFDCPYNYKGRWELLAQAIIDRMGFGEPGEDGSEGPEVESPY